MLKMILRSMSCLGRSLILKNFGFFQKIAHDIDLVPIRTIISKLAFIVGGLVLNKYQSFLSFKTIHVLVCSSDWLTID